MSQMLKCPNPSCPYVFDPSLVPAGVVLGCPRCGMQFTLGPAAGAPPVPPVSPGQPPAPPTPPQRPLELDDEPKARDRPRERQLERERREPERPQTSGRSGVLLPLLLAGVAAVLMAGTGVVIYFLVLRGGGQSQPENLTRLEELNVGVPKPPPGWESDNDTRIRLGSPFTLAYRHEKPEAYAAFGAWEPPAKGLAPRPSETRADLVAAFPKLFDMRRFEQTPDEPEWLGEAVPSGLGFRFHAQSNDGLNWAGEAYAVSHRGVTYYWLAWCRENDAEAMKGAFAEFRGKFKLLGLRENWKETLSNAIHFRGDAVPYTVTDPEDVWREIPADDLQASKEAESALDKRLRVEITPKKDRKGRPAKAELSVYVIDAIGDPKQLARQYAQDLETNRIKSANPDLAPPTFRELTEADVTQGDPVPGGALPSAEVVRLLSDVKDSQDANRLILASGLTVGTKTVVVVAWCDAKQRSVFEKRLSQIASSLRPS